MGNWRYKRDLRSHDRHFESLTEFEYDDGSKRKIELGMKEVSRVILGSILVSCLFYTADFISALK